MQFQRWLTIATSFLETLIFVGLIFGWPSLQFVLEREGFFLNLCRNNLNIDDVNISSMNASTTNSLSCQDAQASFNLIFTLSSTLPFLFSFLLGYLQDRFGSWIYRSIISTLYTLGLIFLILSSPTWSNLLYPGLVLISISGIGLSFSNLQTANLTTNYRGLILSFITGLGLSSSLVFFLVKKGYESGINLTQIFGILIALTIFLWIRTFALMPRKLFPFPLPDSFKFGYKEWKCFQKTSIAKHMVPVSLIAVAASNTMAEKVMEYRDGSGETKKPTSFKTCIKSILFWTNLFYVTVMVFIVNFVFGTTQTWLSSIVDPSEISKLTDDFGIMVFCSAGVAILNGLMYDTITKLVYKTTNNLKIGNLTATMVSAIVTTCFGLVLNIMRLTSNPYGAFVFQLLTINFIFGGFGTFIGINFPPEHIGKLFGLTNLIVGLIGLLQYPLFQLAFAFDPSFYYINIGLIAVTFLTLIHPFFIYLEIRKLKNSECNDNVTESSFKQPLRFVTMLGITLSYYIENINTH